MGGLRRWYVLFVMDTADSMIYTYGHTLSLHDALPIFWGLTLTASLSATRVTGDEMRVKIIGEMWWWRVHYLDAEGRETLRDANELHIPVGKRSEEHTSELQSLMRISYAVFCLKKKKAIRFRASRSRTTEHQTTL